MSIYRAVSSAIFWFRSSSSCHVSLTPCCDRGKPTSIDPYSKGEARGFVFGVVSVWFFCFHVGQRCLTLRRYWVKCNLWILIFGWVGNYFWTHYFYVVLRAKYAATFSCPALVQHRV